jgi:anti-sigma regulatory factor (Ser/Thr protein kinase)
VTALGDRAEALALQLHDASVAAAQLADARDQAKPRQSSQHKVAIAIQQAALDAIAGTGSGPRSLGSSPDALPGFPVSARRLFPGAAINVRAVRDFVSAAFAGHAACEDAVLVAAELAANSIVHSASGQEGGMFMVHLAELDADHVAIVVTDQGGSGVPRERHAGPGAESGRGLTVVRSLTSFLEFFYTGKSTSALAVVPSAGRDTNGLAGPSVRPVAGFISGGLT